MCHLRYLAYFLPHKWRVFRYCNRFGFFWRGVLHDLSRFRPSEWIPHARYFGALPESAARLDISSVDRAWLLHQKRNPHHWHWWIVWSDDGRFTPQRIEEPYLFEMLADWMARAVTLEELRRWWIEKGSKLPIEEGSKNRIGQLIMLHLRKEHFA